jgi:hypothetical protein
LHDRPAPVSDAALVRTAGELTGLDVSPLAPAAFGRGDPFRAVEALYDLIIRLGELADRLAIQE